MLTDDAFNQAILAFTGKSPQQNLIDILDTFSGREIYNDDLVTKVYSVFALTEWQGCGRHDELSEKVREDIEALIKRPPDKLRDVIIVVREICDRLDDLCECDGHPEGRIIKRFIALQDRVRRRRVEDQEVWEEQ